MAFTILLFISGSLQQNYVFSDASTVSSIPTSIAFDNNLSPDDASLSLCTELASASAFLWYKIDASSSLRTITVDTCDVDFDSVIACSLSTMILKYLIHNGEVIDWDERQIRLWGFYSAQNYP